MKIQTLEIRNFKGMKKFKIENLPDIVVLTGGSGAGKSSILLAISCLKEKLITPFQQADSHVSPVFQSRELVNNNSNSCEILVRFQISNRRMTFASKAQL